MRRVCGVGGRECDLQHEQTLSGARALQQCEPGTVCQRRAGASMGFQSDTCMQCFVLTSRVAL